MILNLRPFLTGDEDLVLMLALAFETAFAPEMQFPPFPPLRDVFFRLRRHIEAATRFPRPPRRNADLVAAVLLPPMSQNPKELDHVGHAHVAESLVVRLAVRPSVCSPGRSSPCSAA